jgi:hypothetical protein
MPVRYARKQLLLVGAVMLGGLTFVALSNAQMRPLKPLTISGEFKGRSVMVTAMPRSAGAIESLQWGGIEFIDASDHGRHLQSAVSFDGLTECDNPTEAGASRDGPNSSSSLLLMASASDNVLRTQSRMAYWLRLGQRRECGQAKNDLATPVSSTMLTKSVRFLPGYKNVLEHRISFDLARPRSLAQFEVLTAYMPSRFDTFYVFNPTTSQIEPISDGPGEQQFPVVLSSADGTNALALYTPQPGALGLAGPGYGRWRFGNERVTKSNVVFRQANAGRGGHSFLVYSVFGSLTDVRSTLARLAKDTPVSVADGAPEPFAAEPPVDVLAKN